tara:strand:+ start:844 stop:1482 length:639 start_codon:yes stop_codon:yes gene_type:complete
MTKRTKTQLASQVTSLLPDNTTAEISPEDIRSVYTDYADSLVLWSSSKPSSATTAATATITFSGAATADQTIILIDAAGLSKTYTAKDATSATAGQFIKTDKDAAATALKACIEHANGHNGTITVADNGSGVLTLTQATAGTAGNTAITETLANTAALGGDGATANEFTGGTTLTSCVQGEVAHAVTGSTYHLYVCVATDTWRRAELATYVG